MIRLFEANARTQDFKTNGLLMLKPLKQNENKQLSLNGWTIDVELPIKYSDELSQDMIVVAKTKSKDNPQAFRIKNIEKTTRTIKFQAEHVFYDARDYYLVNVRPTKVNAHTALNYVNDRTDNTSPFTFYSNVNNTSTAYFQDRNLLEAMVTIEERWGGYYDIDNWDIKLLQDVGHDNGEIIAYGKNLEDIKVFEDWTNVVTRLYAVGFDGARFEERYLDSEIKYPTPYTKRVDFQTEFEDEDRILENLIPELRANAERYLETNQYPRIAYEIKSNINQNMEIGDTIHIKHPLVLISTKVQEYDYDMISERVTKLTFGNYSRDVKKRFDAIKDSIDKVTLQTSKQEAIVHHQTDLINNMGKNGHVYRDDNEILILDALPKEEAKKVWRWNMGGLGFSENGIEGPYKQAWTMDGVFNTEFISAGSIMTNHLSSDVGASLDLTSNTSINQIVSGVHQGNNIPNLNGNIELIDWQGTTGRLKGITTPYRLKGIKNLRGNMNAYPVQSKQFLSTWGIEFYGPGEMISPLGAIVTDNEYSWKGRILPFKPFTVKAYEQKEHGYDLYIKNRFEVGSLNKNTGLELDSSNRVRSSNFLKVSSNTLDLIKSNVNYKYLVRMYDENYEFLSGAQPWISDTNKSVSLNNGTQYVKLVIGHINDSTITPDDIPSQLLSIYDENARPFKETEFTFNTPQEYNQFTMQPHNDTKFIKLGFSIPTASLESRVTLTEMMFNMGEPRSWFENAKDTQMWAESHIKQVNNRITSTVEEVKTVDKKTEENKSVIDQQAHEIELRVEKDNVIGGINASAENVKILSERLEFDNAVGKNVDLTGRITATSGKIGGYAITGNNLVGNEVSLGQSQISVGSGDITADSHGNMSFNRIGKKSLNMYGNTRFYETVVLDKTLNVEGKTTMREVSVWGNIIPTLNSNLGSSAASNTRFNNIYLSRQPNVSSDKRLKNNILNIDDNLIQVFGQAVKPKTYMMNGSSDIHFGYIAQDIETALYKYNLKKHGLNKANEEVDKFALLSRSDEYMSLLYGEIAVIMDAYNRKRSDDLEKRIKKIEELLLERND